MTHVATAGPKVEGTARIPAARGFYVGIVVAMIGVVLLGFRPFYVALFTGGTGAHWLIYVHAAVFSAWMALLLVQVVLVYRRKVRAHQRLGQAGIYLGVLVLLLGLAISFAAPVLNVLDGRSTLDEAAGFLILPLGDMALFAGFFAAGIAYRRRKELHKRLMLLATIALLFAPAARLGGGGGPLVILAVWLFPLLLAMAYDGVSRRRVEPIYYIGLVVLLVAFARVGLMESEAWLGIGRRLLLAVMPSPGA